ACKGWCKCNITSRRYNRRELSSRRGISRNKRCSPEQSGRREPRQNYQYNIQTPLQEKRMNIPLVDLKSQYLSIKNEIDGAIQTVLNQTDFIGGSAIKTFEQAFADFSGLRYVVGVANGTDAIHLALRACGIGPGDEVITAVNIFIATSEAITASGAKVVFVDNEPLTYTIDAA